VPPHCPAQAALLEEVTQLGTKIFLFADFFRISPFSRGLQQKPRGTSHMSLRPLTYKKETKKAFRAEKFYVAKGEIEAQCDHGFFISALADESQRSEVSPLATIPFATSTSYLPLKKLGIEVFSYKWNAGRPGFLNLRRERG
jgi:hypothetical protein